MENGVLTLHTTLAPEALSENSDRASHGVLLLMALRLDS